MRIVTKRNGVILSTFLVLILVLQAVFFPLGNWLWDDRGRTVKANVDTGSDERIAYELSNMSGVPVEKIISLKSEGLTWNEVRELLRDQEQKEVQDGKDSRDSLIVGSGMSEQTISQLVAEGYEKQTIVEAKLVAERTAYQLSELIQGVDHIPVTPAPVIEQGISDDMETKERYRNIHVQFQLEDAVMLMLSWLPHYDSLRQVLNEYLFMLQTGLEVNRYITDWDGYQEEKNRILRERVGEDWITAEMLEKELVEVVQKSHKQPENKDIEDIPKSPYLVVNSDQHIPIPPNPNVADVKPLNPTSAIYEEIRSIDPKEGLK